MLRRAYYLRNYIKGERRERRIKREENKAGGE
jgi:uncharacterized membrane protein YciS (DUF1049 family)